MRLLEKMVEKPHPCAYLPAREREPRGARHARRLRATRWTPCSRRGVAAIRSDLLPARVRVLHRVREPARRGRPLRAEQEPAPGRARVQPPAARRGPAPRRRGAPRALRQVARRAASRRAAGSPTGRPRSATRSSSRSPIPARARRLSTTTTGADGSWASASSTRRRARSRRRSSSTTRSTRGCRSGRANILSLIEDARASARPHVYLGYRVEGCASLRYKAAFRPHELLRERPESLDDAAPWAETPP